MLPTEGITTIEKALLFANMEKNGLKCVHGLTFLGYGVKVEIDPRINQFSAKAYHEYPDESGYLDRWVYSRQDENYTDVMDILGKLHTDGLINEIHEIE